MLPDIAKIRWLIKQASPPECWIPGWESTEGEVCRASRSTGQIIADSTYISAVAPAIILAILDRLDILEEVTTAARAMREATEEYVRMCEDDEMDAEKYKQAQTVEYKATRALDDALDRLKE